MYEIEDEKGGFLFNAVGHSFNLILCEEAEGIPLPFPNDCSLSPGERFYVGCVDSGCHLSEQAAASALGSTIHNPFLMEALLIASIGAVEDEYGDMLPRVSGRDWEAELRRVLDRTAAR